MDYYHTSPSEFTKGQRVATHPATDVWMRGDRYGVVTNLTKRFVSVRLDKSNRVVKFVPADLAIVG